ncbi:MAG TPA: hypothetical protein VFN67_34575 [Polyangiales bacterium]|nr:hypothetical protein [Polyangiales bacterium]
MRVTKEQVLVELHKHPRGATNSMIAAALDATDSNVSSYMGRLVRAGLAIETGERWATGRGSATGAVFKVVEQPSAAPLVASAPTKAAGDAQPGDAASERVLAEIRAKLQMLPSISAKLDALSAALDVHAHAAPPPVVVQAADAACGAVVPAVVSAASVAPPSSAAVVTKDATSALGRCSTPAITTMQLDALVTAASATTIGPLSEISDSDLGWLEARRDLAVDALKHLCEDWTVGRGHDAAVKIAFARWKLLNDYACYHNRPHRDGNFEPLDFLESWRMLLACRCDEWSVAQAVAVTRMLFGTRAVSQLSASTSIRDLAYQLADHRGAMQSLGPILAA